MTDMSQSTNVHHPAVNRVYGMGSAAKNPDDFYVTRSMPNERSNA